MSWTNASLIAAAREAARGAYAPYSKFHVGAAPAFADGSVVTEARITVRRLRSLIQPLQQCP